MAGTTAKAKVYRPQPKAAKAPAPFTADDAENQADNCVSMHGTFQEWKRPSCERLIKRAKGVGVTLELNDLLPPTG